MIKEELVKAKEELEVDIEKAIKDFEEKTGIEVMSIMVRHRTPPKDIDLDIGFYFRQ